MHFGITERKVLDADLYKVVQSELRSTEFPLAIRRFAEFAKKPRATDALIEAVDQVLQKYQHGTGLKLPVSVRALCKLMDVKLARPLPSQQASANYTDSSSRALSGHTGLLRLEDSRPVIEIPRHIDYEVARLSVAHELGHLLLHRRGNELDEVMLRMPADPFEEALAEYAARLLLLPRVMWHEFHASTNLAEYAVTQSSTAHVSVHAAVARLGDPDLVRINAQGAILWRELPEAKSFWPMHERMTPWWHLCPGAFIPIRKSKARSGSLVAILAAKPGAHKESRIEDVDIGSFVGIYMIDAFAWGSFERRSRSILTVFRPPADDGLSDRQIQNDVAEHQGLLPLW